MFEQGKCAINTWICLSESSAELKIEWSPERPIGWVSSQIRLGAKSLLQLRLNLRGDWSYHLGDWEDGLSCSGGLCSTELSRKGIGLYVAGNGTGVESEVKAARKYSRQA